MRVISSIYVKNDQVLQAILKMIEVCTVHSKTVNLLLKTTQILGQLDKSKFRIILIGIFFYGAVQLQGHRLQSLCCHHV